jgi:hypothetical protein
MLEWISDKVVEVYRSVVESLPDVIDALNGVISIDFVHGGL